MIVEWSYYWPSLGFRQKIRYFNYFSIAAKSCICFLLVFFCLPEVPYVQAVVGPKAKLCKIAV